MALSSTKKLLRQINASLRQWGVKSLSSQPLISRLAKSIASFQPNTPHYFEARKFEICDEFIRDDGRRIPLLKGYRNLIKSRWKLDYWPIAALFSAHGQVSFSSKAQSLLGQLSSSACQTLPVSLDEIAEVVNELAEKNPQVLLKSSLSSPMTRLNIIAARIALKQADSMVRYHQKSAERIILRWQRITRGRRQLISQLRTSEIGCGMGYTVQALGGMGVREACGIDLAANNYRSLIEKPTVSQRLLQKLGPRIRKAQLIVGDITNMKFPPDQFDLIYSASVLEHIHGLEKSFCEMARVLRPGGIMIHEFPSYFAPNGGHSSCTLDFPWGHARLSRNEFRRYIGEFRPHEKEHAWNMYNNLFNNPRLSLHEIELAIHKAGLTILQWVEMEFPKHSPVLEYWREVNEVYHMVTERDMKASAVRIVLTKP